MARFLDRASETMIARYAIRKVLKLGVDEDSINIRDWHRITRFVKEKGNSIVKLKKGMYYCGFCGKGPFTRRGIYLHLLRVHLDEVLDAILE
ncbi:hypothetical protein ACSU1N_06180 [Thermogladius sp. 4427co]|uniref:hypothetical protein n=1 Tax=Thermogladius sp. 4427co TaxID=3450718 RepID=UPI003F79CBD3